MKDVTPKKKAPEPLDTHKLAAARLWAATRFPYLSSALFASRVIAVPGINTMAVDESWRIYVDPQIANSWTVQELGSMLVHHSGHLLRDHAGRARSLGIDKESAKDWALAADAEINDDLAEGIEPPGELVTPGTIGCEDGKMAEEYFHHIQIQQPDCPECGSGAHSQHREWDMGGDSFGIKEASAHLIRCQVAHEILERGGTDPGTVPLGLQRWAEALLKPKVDWRKVLAGEVRRGIASEIGKVDYTYARPSRRAVISPDVVLPSLRRPIPEVAVICDTSGSMHTELLSKALAEVEGLLRTVGVRKRGLRVLSVDTNVHAVQQVSSARQVQLYGGAGRTWEQAWKQPRASNQNRQSSLF